MPPIAGLHSPPTVAEIVDVFEMRLVEEVVDGAIACAEGLEVDTDDTYKMGKAEQGVREKSSGELKLVVLFMFQGVESKPVSPYCKGCDKPAPALMVADYSHGDVAVCHANDHTLPKVESKKKNQGVKDSSLNRGNKGDHKVGVKLKGLEDKANVCRYELSLLVLGCCTESHLVGAFVVDPVADLGDWAFVG